MIDTRQVMYDIERCISHVPDACMDCSHYNGTVFGCMEALMENALALLKGQEAEIRQLRLALDIVKGTCKGVKSGGGQFADMPTMQSAT